MRTLLQAWVEAGWNLLYPPVCQLCRRERAGRAEGFVGTRCRTGPGGVRYVRPPFCERCGLPYEGGIDGPFRCSNCADLRLEFAWARAAAVAGPLVLEVIHRYKYRQAVWFEPFLAGLLVSQAAAAVRDGGFDAIVPVPLHPLKLRERGFNQAERLARWLGRAAGVPVQTGWVRRVRPTRTQTALDRDARQKNMRGAFEPRNGVRLNGQRIVLVDDVLTTGATTSACAAALRRAGAGEIGVWTVARGL
ncbi:MAG: ComF family protein [Verrucomicrobia bacterium]|nr:MAG: ComF family protein [Verrucomicrobiota bacterium]